MADQDKNPIVTITNKSDVDVEIYDTFNAADRDASVLTYTRLATLAKGETKKVQTLHGASQLQAMYTGPVAALAGRHYVQFPVAVIPTTESQETPYTITTADQRGMEQAFLFHRYTVANADSTIAKDFVVALAATGQTVAVNKFFAATKNFRDCSLSAWTAVVTWSSQFTSAWQGTYYLYGVLDKGSSEIPKWIATLTITSTAAGGSAALVLTDSKVSTDVSMNGSGVEESNIGEGASVSLKPVWLNLGAERNLIGAAMTGVVNAVPVFGTGEKRPEQPAPKGDSGPETARRNFDSVFPYITGLGGLALGVVNAFLFYKTFKNGHTQKSDRAAEDAARRDGTEDSIERARAAEDAAYRRGLQEVPLTHPEIPRGLERASAEMGPALQELSARQAGARVQTQVDQQIDRLEDVLSEEAPTRALEATAEKLSDIQSDLAKGDYVAAETKLGATVEAVDRALAEPKLRKYEQDALNETKKALEEATRRREAVKKAAEARRRTAEASSEDTTLDPDDLTEDPFEAEIEAVR